MLTLKNINKSYKLGSNRQKVLNNINLKFRKNEFVSILGPSGSGKTTLLNIIGGLDNYDNGDLIINGMSTKKFNDKDWDAYRNNSIGFIFQSYNLISHMNILENVELCMTLSGISYKKRKKKAITALKDVGLEKHIYKKPNQLSGGQMQRVAIARALVNNPDIILADEPTGALDSNSSDQIMKILKNISKTKLVIMVTHNPDIAKTYSTRIINIKDGIIVSDTNPYNKQLNNYKYKLKKTSMNFYTALNLSFKNLLTKKARTILTSFACSIGIIGISLILSLSNGFSKQIDKFEKDTSDVMPIIISTNKINNEYFSDITKKDDNSFTDEKKVFSNKNDEKVLYNNINDEFMNYLSNMDSDNLSSISFNYGLSINLIQNNNNDYYTINSLNTDNNKLNIECLPFNNFNDNNISELITNYYDVLSGNLPSNKDEILLEIDSSNHLDEIYLKALGLDSNDVSFEDIIGKTMKVVFNNDYYQNKDKYFFVKDINNQMYNNSNNLTLKVVGIIRVKKEKENVINSSNTIYYTRQLMNYIMNINDKSDIVKSQENSNYSVLTMQKFLDNSSGERTKENLLIYLGKKSNPISINLYPKNFESKDLVTKYIDKYNNDKSEKDKISYLDQAKVITSISGGIMSGITTVLVAFSSISLIVSSIMIGIITYISVLERVREIGILRSIGARKKDIKRVFSAETFIIGFFSGLFGILLSRILLIPINIILKNITSLDNVAIMNMSYSVILIIISIILTLISGLIPSKIASNKNPVEALRTN